MTRNFKVLGLAVVAFLAMSAMMASAASAQKFTTTNGATLTGSETSQHKFTVTGQTVTCTTVGFHGVAPGAEFTEVKVTPTYTNCKAEPLGNSATVTGFGHFGESKKCWYVLKANGGAALQCDAGADVTVDAGPCVVHVPAQEFASGVTYTNNTSGTADLDVSFEIKNIKASHTDGFLCPFGSGGESSAAVLEGTATVVAEVAGVPVPGSWDK